MIGEGDYLQNTTEVTGYPSIDKPWLKYYSSKEQNRKSYDGSAYGYVWQENKEHLDEVALVYYGKEIKYGALFDKINKVADAFEHMGVKKGDIVTICALNMPETIYSFYALNQLGAIANFVDLRASVQIIHHFIEEVKSKYVICLDAVYKKIVSATRGLFVSKVIVISPANSLSMLKKSFYILKLPEMIEYDELVMSWENFIASGTRKSDYVNEASIGAMITHSSGTTHKQKSILLSNENINYAAYQAADRQEDNRKHRHLAIIPPFITVGFCIGIHLPLVSGMNLALIPLCEPTNLDEYIRKYKPNYFTCAPSNFNYLLQTQKKCDFSSFIVPSTGGDFLSEEQEKKINAFLRKHNSKSILQKGYGIAEMASTGTITSKKCNDVSSVGYPLEFTTVSIFKPETDIELKYGEEGEICFQGPTMMMEYFKDAKETEKIRRTHSDGSIWIHSGDIGYMKEDGQVFVVDRIKRMIHCDKDKYILPKKIEEVVNQFEFIDACAVVAVRSKQNEEQEVPIAFIVLEDTFKKNEKAIKAELFEFAKKNLDKDMCPVDYIFIEELPLSPYGKIDILMLADLAKERYWKNK